MDVRFVVGEHSLFHLGNEPSDSARIHSFIELLDAASVDRVLVWEELFAVPVDGYASLSDFLFGPDATVDRDLRLLLGVRLQRIETWGDEDDAPDFAFTDDSRSIDFAPSVGLCAKKVATKPWAVLCVEGSGFSGLRTLRSMERDAPSVDVWFTDSRETLVEFLRDAFTRYGASAQEIGDLASDAFPGTTFAPGVWSQSSRFRGKWVKVRPLLIDVLSGLDDGVVRIFAESVQSHERTALMSAKHGVDCSPESPNTHRNAKAMKEREARFEDRVRVCEWHAKLQPDCNRVHFTVEDRVLYVGIFAEHLLI